MALRDHYSELAATAYAAQQNTIKEAADIQRSAGVAEEILLPTADDRWALSCIGIAKIQPLIEALDEDGSSFVTVAEANAFTASRPANWRCEIQFFEDWRVTGILKWI